MSFFMVLECTEVSQSPGAQSSHTGTFDDGWMPDYCGWGTHEQGASYPAILLISLLSMHNLKCASFMRNLTRASICVFQVEGRFQICGKLIKMLCHLQAYGLTHGCSCIYNSECQCSMFNLMVVVLSQTTRIYFLFIFTLLKYLLISLYHSFIFQSYCNKKWYFLTCAGTKALKRKRQRI